MYQSTLKRCTHHQLMLPKLARFLSASPNHSNALPYREPQNHNENKPKRSNTIYELDIDEVNPLIQTRPSHVDMSSSARTELLSMIQSMKKYDGGENDVYTGAPSSTVINKLRQSARTLSDTSDVIADAQHKLAKAQEYRLFKRSDTDDGRKRDYVSMNAEREKQRRKREILKQLQEDQNT